MRQIYAVYVGEYPTPSVPKKDVLRLNKCNLNAYVFAVDNHYSLRVNAFLNEEKAVEMVTKLRDMGFKAYYKTQCL